MKFRTIDCEADGLYRTLNQKLFPEGNHFDPGSILWCVTFCDQDYNTLTLVKKLPETPRHVKDGHYTKAVHYKDSIVPKEIDGHKVVEYTETSVFLKAIFMEIMMGSGDIYCKGYREYNYDAMLLKSYFSRNGMEFCNIYFNLLKAVNPKSWEETSNQVKSGQWISNQDYMVTGIRHNIEDAMQLAKRINNGEVDGVTL